MPCFEGGVLCFGTATIILRSQALTEPRETGPGAVGTGHVMHMWTLIQVLPAFQAEPSTIVTTDRLERERRRLILPDGLAEVEFILLVDAEVVRLGLDRLPRYGVLLRHKLLVDRDRQRLVELLEAAGAGQVRARDQVGVRQHTSQAAHQADSTHCLSDIIHLRNQDGLVLQRELAAAADGLLEQRRDVVLHLNLR